MMPRAGGQYVYLRKPFRPCGVSLRLDVVSGDPNGTIAAVAVGFHRFLGVVVRHLPTAWIVKPVNLSTDYAISLSLQQLLAILLIVFLTLINTRGLSIGKWIQNIFTSAKTLSLLALIVLGIFVGRSAEAVSANFSDFWAIRGVSFIQPDSDWLPALSATDGLFGLLVAFCVAQVGSLFSSDAWNNITFTAGEVREPQRNIPLALALGTGTVVVLYLLANVAYLSTLALEKIQQAPDDRVATAMLSVIFGDSGAIIMAIHRRLNLWL
jgi:APA family basic amino acid/polyamine antiporter